MVPVFRLGAAAMVYGSKLTSSPDHSYHTQHNRRVRQVDLKKIDFASSKVLIHQALDKVKAEDIEDVTPGSK